MDNEKILEFFGELGDRREKFVEGETFIPVVDFTVNGDEYINIVSSLLGVDRDYSHSFTTKLFDYLGGGYMNIVDSFLSPHQVIISSLCDDLLRDRKLKAGDEVITTADNLSIILALKSRGVIPVILDVDLDTMLPSIVELESAIEEGKTKAIFLSCPNGNFMDEEKLRDIVDEFGILYIEDVGYGFGGECQKVPVGTYADVSIYSFYSKFFGCINVVVSKSSLHHRIISENLKSSISGFEFSNPIFGYMSAQMDKIDYLTAMRGINFSRLALGLGKYSGWFKFQKSAGMTLPSWTMFSLSLKPPYEHKFTLRELMSFLDTKNIGYKKLCGNATNLDLFCPQDYRIFTDVMTSDYIQANTLAIGCGPNMTEKHTNYIISCFDEFMQRVNGK